MDEPVVTGKSGEFNSRHEEHRAHGAVPALNVRVTSPVAAAAVPPAIPVCQPLLPFGFTIDEMGVRA